MVVRTVNIYSFMLILLVALSLGACSSDDVDENTTEPENQTNEESDAIDDTNGDTADDPTEDATDDTGDATDDSSEDATGDTTDDTSDDINDECDYVGFESVSEDAALITAFDAFTYLAQNTLDAPVDTLNFDITNIPAAGDIIVLDDTNYAECDPCVTIWMGCDADLANCSKTFLVQEGEMTIDSIGESGDIFSGTVTDALLVEVDINDEFESTPVENGESWCLPSYEFNEEIQ